ncbi:MAG: hypothetical protein WDN00_06165 [Limisphaerales bacterium]
MFRIVWEDNSTLRRRNHLNDAQPQIKPWGDGTEYAWEFTNLTAIPYEDRKPADCEPYPYIELSDFADWAAW